MRPLPVQFNATNGETLAPCDKEVYRKGEVVVVSPLGKDATEFAVQRMKEAGLMVDWHFYRNRIMVKVIGCVKQAREMWWRIVNQFKLNHQWLVQ